MKYVLSLLLGSFLVLSACSSVEPAKTSGQPAALEDDYYIHLAKRNTENGVVTITEDRGGDVYARIVYIKTVIERQGLSVRIVARECASACTMYIGASDVCAMPYTRFMFHGPWKEGVSGYANSALFDSDSRIMARFYPEPVRTAFMEKYRYYGPSAFYTISGAELIAAGLVRAC